jgi:hypothetical protein
VLDIFDVRVGNSIDVRCESACQLSVPGNDGHMSIGMLLTASSEFVINLLLEQKHRLFRKIIQKTKQLWASEQIAETLVTIGKVLSSAENSLVFVINLLFDN